MVMDEMVMNEMELVYGILEVVSCGVCLLLLANI